MYLQFTIDILLCQKLITLVLSNTIIVINFWKSKQHIGIYTVFSFENPHFYWYKAFTQWYVLLLFSNKKIKNKKLIYMLKILICIYYLYYFPGLHRFSPGGHNTKPRLTPEIIIEDRRRERPVVAEVCQYVLVCVIYGRVSE